MFDISFSSSFLVHESGNAKLSFISPVSFGFAISHVKEWEKDSCRHHLQHARMFNICTHMHVRFVFYSENDKICIKFLYKRLSVQCFGLFENFLSMNWKLFQCAEGKSIFEFVNAISLHWNAMKLCPSEAFERLNNCWDSLIKSRQIFSSIFCGNRF